ncbi:multidrug resistance protein Stp [Sphingopyxis fribergensis]|uniref:Multidrug resistance protein Stp n=1 Tax=Sphingopyxis fribergensis TaxID=1515612 RepID=A0A0A7PGT7_9SPHN|nr:MFS transporter [Sphingopyxis fribergensis]AJA09175.1 multidrug resistance protein Stp [Sphingopyxis fribergensis]
MTAALPTPCDSAVLGRPEGQLPPHPRWTLVATILASSLAFIDGSVVNVALPAIDRSLDAGAAGLQWTVNAYLLPLSALLLLGGAAGDQMGQRRMLIAGILVFLAASLACAVAPTIEVLLAARALQGVGAAMLMPNSLGILGNSFRGESKGRAIGTWAAVGAIASAVGPPLGGWLIEVAGWRAIFYLNLPVGAAAIFVAWRYVANDKGSGKPLDWVGAALVTLGLGLLTWSLTLWSNDGIVGGTVLFGLIAGVAMLAAFIFVERARGDAAMMPLSLFASKAFAGLTFLTFALYGALGGLLVLLPYLLITSGYSPLEAGLALLPFPLVIGLASRWIGQIAAGAGPRWPLTLGPIVAGAGFLLLHRVDPAAGYVVGVLPGLFVIALGMAGAVAPLTTAVLSAVDDQHMGTASGFNSAIARTGGLIATALVGVVLSQSGDALLSAFRTAAVAGGVLAGAAGFAAWATLGDPEQSGR